MIVLKKLVRKSSLSSAPSILERPTPIPYFHPLFIICWIFLPRESNKIHSPPPFKRQGGTNYV